MSFFRPTQRVFARRIAGAACGLSVLSLLSFGAARAAGPLPRVLPLSLKIGPNSGLSFLYLTPPPVPIPTRVPASPSALYGFSNQLALGSAGQFKGMMYLAGGAKNGKASQIISQSLGLSGGAWKFEAHYQDVGKDADGFSALRGATPSLGLLSGMTGDALGGLEAARGKSGLGASLGWTTRREHFAASWDSLADQKARQKTMRQSLAYGRAFGGGVQLDLSRDTTQTAAMDAKAASSATTNHLRLGFDRGHGLALVGDARLVSGSAGLSERHLAFNLVGATRDLSYKANFATDSDSKGRNDRALNLDVARQFKTLLVGASLTRLTPAAGRGAAMATERVQLNWQPGSAFALDGFWTQTHNPGAQSGEAGAHLLHLNWQVRRGLTFEGRLTQDTNSRWAQVGQERQLLLRGLLARNLEVDARTSEKTVGATGKTETLTDIKTCLTVPRLASISNARLALSVGDHAASDQPGTGQRGLTFDGEMRKHLVHLECSANGAVGADKKPMRVASRALRIVSAQPRNWVQYNLYLKNRKASVGPALPDIRDYQVRMQLRTVALLYRYASQRENPDGTVADVVQTEAGLSGPAGKKLAWNAQYVQTNNAAGTARTDGFSLGVKGATGAHQTLDFAAGFQQRRVGANLVGGETLKVNYQARTSDTDFIALDGQMATWNAKTPQTPDWFVGTVRLDVKKVY